MKLSTRIKLLFRRRSIYRAVFMDEDGEITEDGAAVLGDLGRYARAYASTTAVSPVMRTVDTHATMLAEGRREVFNRIVKSINLTESQIYALMEREYARATQQS